MVMTNEFFVKFKEHNTGVARHSSNYAFALQIGKISIHRALGKSGLLLQQIGNAHWSSKVEQQFDELAPTPRVHQLATAQSLGHQTMHCVAALLHEYERNSRRCMVNSWPG